MMEKTVSKKERRMYIWHAINACTKLSAWTKDSQNNQSSDIIISENYQLLRKEINLLKIN